MTFVTQWLEKLIDPFAPANGTPPKTLIPFARWSLSGAEKAIALSLCAVSVAGMVELMSAAFAGWVVDRAANAAPGAYWDQFAPLIIFGLVFYMIVRPVALTVDAATTSVVLGPHLFPLIISRLNRYALGHSMRYFENDFAGRISQKCMQTARSLTDIVIETVDVVIFSFMMFVGALILMGGIDGRLLIGFAVWGLLYGCALWYFIPRVMHKSKARAGARTVVTGQLVDTLSNIATVKLFAHNSFEDRAALDALATFRDRALEFGYLSAGFRMVLMTLGGILPVMSILGSLYLWSIGQATVGDITVTAMIGSRLSMLTNRLGFTAISIFSSIGEVEDGMQTLAKTHEVVDRPDAAMVLDAHGPIEFDRVGFSYGGEITAIHDLDLTIGQGEKLAVVGASGAGKSTFVSLLLRLYDVEQGRILINSVDIRDVTQEALRRQISVVRQETAMFNRSALDNIRYGKPDATIEEVIEAAKMAAAHDFIADLRDGRGRSGYDAYLGERGVKLSGGQRQRIALARAILKDAPILILDEATSALDSEVEAEIQTSLDHVMEGKTVIAIAHRLSTIARMDRIVVMEKGRIAEIGTHSELLAKQGIYAGFWARQSGGFLGAE